MSITRIQNSVFMSTPIDKKKKVVVKGNMIESVSAIGESFLETMNQFQKSNQEEDKELKQKAKEEKIRKQQWEAVQELFNGYSDSFVGTRFDSAR